MLYLLTDLPRESGVGQYVVDLTRVVPESTVFYRRAMSNHTYELTGHVRDSGLLTEAVYYLRCRTSLRSLAPQTHVTWEGFGPVFGPATRLITIHHVLQPRHRGGSGGPLRSKGVAALAVRGQELVARLGVPCTVPSNSVKAELVDGFGADPSQVTVVPHAVDASRFSPTPKNEARALFSLPEEEFVIVHIGDNDVRKGTQMVLGAFDLVRQVFPSVRLVHIGPSPLFERWASCNPTHQITYIRHVPSNILPRVYSSADVLFQPSTLEGFSYTLIEAMACGVPCVTSDLPIFREQMGDFFQGPSVNSPESFAELLKQFVSGQVAIKPGALRARAIELFSFSSFANRMKAIYRQVGLL